MHASGASDSGVLARLVDGKRGSHILRPGASLTFRVESHGDQTVGLVHRNGLRIAVPVGADLRIGETVRFTVLASKPSLLLTRIYRETTTAGTGRDTMSSAVDIDSSRTLVDRFLDQERLSDVPGARELARALIASHRHLAPESMHRLTSLFALLTRRTHDDSERPGARNRLARAVVELRDRSIEVSDPTTSAESDLVAWLSDAPHDRPRDDRRGEQRPRKPAIRGSADDLPSYLHRATDAPDHPLQLFNALKTTGDLHWIVIPIGATAGSGVAEARVEGTLKLAVSQASGSVEGASLAVGRGERRWRFSWHLKGGHLRLCRATVDHGAQPIPETLLARLGVTRHTGRVASEGDDGFTIGMIEGGQVGVDQYG